MVEKYTVISLSKRINRKRQVDRHRPTENSLWASKGVVLLVHEGCLEEGRGKVNVMLTKALGALGGAMPPRTDCTTMSPQFRLKT